MEELQCPVTFIKIVMYGMRQMNEIISLGFHLPCHLSCDQLTLSSHLVISTFALFIGNSKTDCVSLHYCYSFCVVPVKDCPGTSSDQAGKTSACQGCPNQNICASGAAKAPDPGKE